MDFTSILVSFVLLAFTLFLQSMSIFVITYKYVDCAFNNIYFNLLIVQSVKIIIILIVYKDVD